MKTHETLADQKRAFWLHLSAYVVINIMLAAVNLRSAPENIWFIWPLLGWGIGVAGHGLALVLEALSLRGGALARKETREFIVHLFAYLSVSLLLAFINLSGDSDGLWFHWVVAGWGLGVGLHGLALWRGAGES